MVAIVNKPLGGAVLKWADCMLMSSHAHAMQGEYTT